MCAVGSRNYTSLSIPSSVLALSSDVGEIRGRVPVSIWVSPHALQLATEQYDTAITDRCIDAHAHTLIVSHASHACAVGRYLYPYPYPYLIDR